jgi:HAD superfamily hydrolase (TIGR01509 family)
MNLALQRFWIFDMDGTLTVAAHDFDAIRKTLGLIPGQPILEQLAMLPAERADPLKRRLDGIELEIARRATPQPGARELLTFLDKRGATFGILTRNSQGNALETLSTCGLSEFFEPRFVLGREACDPKPSPEGIRRLLREWGARASEAVMVGDFLFDLESGRDAGTATVYVDPSGTFQWAALADASVRDLHELLRLVENHPRPDF